MTITTLAVMIIVITSVTIPAVETAQEEQFVTNSNVVGTYKVIEDGGPIEIAWLSANTCSINGSTITQPGSDILISSNVIISLAANNIQVRNLGATSSDDFSLDTGASQGTDQKVTIEDGILTTSGGKSCTIDGPIYYLTTDDADIALFTYGSEFFVDKDSIITTVVPVTIDGVQYRVILSGTYDNLKVSNAWNVSGNQPEDPDDFQAELTGNSVVEELEKCVKIKNQTFRITYSDESASNTRYVFAPIEYTVISGFNSMTISLLGLIPLMLIIGVVMIAARAISYRD